MSGSAIDALIARQEALLTALAGDGAPTIEQALRDHDAALAQVIADRAWRTLPDAKPRLERALALIDAARLRVNFLTDLTRRRLDALNEARGAPRVMRYGRNGRVAA